MFCKKCGAQLADGQLFCGNCGTPSFKEEGVGQAQTVNQTHVNQSPVNRQPYAGVNNAQYNPAMFAEKRSPKKNKKPVILAAVIAAIVILAIVAVICVPMIKRSLMSDRDIMAMHDRDVIEDGLEAFSSSVGSVGEDAKYNGSIGIKLSDYLAGQLSSYIGDIDSAEIGFDVASKKDKYGCKIDISLSDTEIITLDVTADIESDKLYITAPGLVDGALELDMGMFMPEDGKASLSSLMENMSSLKISDKVINEALALIDAAYGEAGEAVETKEALTIDGVSQNCTVYTLTIDEETAAKMVVAFLEKLKKSENIKDFAGDLVENYYDGLTREEVISEIEVFCDSGIESLTEEDPVFGDNTMVYTMYVSSDDVIGRTVEVNGVKITAATVKNGRDKAFEYSIHQEFEGDVKFVGKGTEDKSGFTGEASLTVFEDEIINLECDKFSCDDDKISGSVAVSFGSGLEELYPYDEEMVTVLSSLDVVLDFDTTKKASKVSIALSLMGFDLGEITLEGTSDSNYKPAVPEGQKYSDPEEFGSKIDVSELFTRLSQAGFDLSGLMGGMLG